MYIHIFAIQMGIEQEIKQGKFRSEEQKLIINLMFTGSWINGIQTRFFKQFDLSPQQYNVLKILKGQGGKEVSIGLISERMIDRTSNASRLVDKLKLKNLVSRKTNKLDRRLASVAITKEGMELLSRIDVKVIDIEKQIVNMNNDRIDQLNRTLDELRESSIITSDISNLNIHQQLIQT